MAPDERKPIKIDPAIQRAIKIEAANRDVTMQDLIAEAWHFFAAKTSGKPLPRNEPSEWHRKLTEILGSGDQAMIATVTQSIDVFHDRLRPARRKRAV
jgi:hypothetical protein